MSIATIPIRTSGRCQLVDITDRVQEAVAKAVAAAGAGDGVAIVHVPHTTAAVTINENADPDVQHDVLAKLAEMIPKSERYYQTGEV